MATVLVTFIVMLVAVAALAVGVMLGRKPIGGSCGGISAAGGDSSCACGREAGSCGTDAPPSYLQKKAQFVDASK